MEPPTPPPIHEARVPPMHLTCPHCQTRLETSPGHAGSTITCPRCDGKFMAPLPTANQEVDYRSAGFQNTEFKSFVAKKIAAGLCGILLGCLGIHKFILGITTPAIIMLLVSILTCGYGAIPMGIIGLIEGIIYLTKSDEDFYQLYAIEKKGWF